MPRQARLNASGALRRAMGRGIEGCLYREAEDIGRHAKGVYPGCAVNFNRRHGRYGHLFQNRYESILCEEEPYPLELTRYIDLNSIRAGIKKTMRELAGYPWTGGAVILGRVRREWQNVDTLLAYFGEREKGAIRESTRDMWQKGRGGESVRSWWEEG